MKRNGRTPDLKQAVKPEPKQNGKYKKLLQARKTSLLEGLDEIKFDTIAKMGRVAEEDQAQLSHEEFITLHRNSVDYQQLRLVQEALERLQTGEYGVCQNCESPIPIKRLEALPWAKYCVRCQDRMAGSGNGAYEHADLVAEQQSW